MRDPMLVLQNEGGSREGQTVEGPWPKQSQRTLTAQETDLLLTESMWSRQRRKLVDNHSGDFRLFKIF